MKTVMQWIGGVGLAMATQACVVRDAQPVSPGYGYGYGYGGEYGGGYYVEDRKGFLSSFKKIFRR